MSKHPDTRLIQRYTSGDLHLDEVTVWSLEAHLQTCATCRALQADLLCGPATTGSDALDTARAVFQRVALELDDRISTGPGPSPVTGRWRAAARRWAVGSLVPWMAMTIGMLLAALALSLAAPQRPSAALLIAPVLPLLGVAGTWSRRTDPAWELIAGSPRVGLWLLLRRTALTLGVVIPPLLIAGWVGGFSPALWLLPCLGLVLTTLAVGERIGLVPAAAGTWLAWMLAVLVPSLVTAEMPAVLQTSAAPGWITLILLAAGTVALRRGEYTRLISRL